jgi:hypothetical protein
MSQMNAITCTHTALEHLLHPLCPAQSDLRKVANIVVPLFLVLGAIYYGWRYFHLARQVEQTSELEKKIDMLIKGRFTDQAYELIGTMPHSDKRSNLYNRLDEEMCNDYLQSSDYKNLESALKKALSITDASKKESLLEKIFKAALKNGFLGLVDQVMRYIYDKAKIDELRSFFIDEAMRGGELSMIIKAARMDLETESTRNGYFDRLASLIAEKLLVEEIAKEFLPIGRHYPIPTHGLLYRISLVFSQKKDFIAAQKLADSISEIIPAEGSEEINESAHETRAMIYVDCKEWVNASLEANLIKNTGKRDSLLEKISSEKNGRF